MKVLVTGGRGYVGGRLCSFLADDPECQVFSGTRSESSKSSSCDRISSVTTDWNSMDSLVSCCTGMDAIVHLAAINSADSWCDPVAALEVNALGTARLMRAAIQVGVRRFVYISTAHVYGQSLVGTITEKTYPLPVHPYATSHRAAEDLVVTSSYLGSSESVVLRLSNGFGLPMREEVDCWNLVFNDLCRQVVMSGEIVLRSSGLHRRDFITLTDVCKAIRHFLKLSTASLRDNVFNLGGEWSPTILDVATLVADRFETRGYARPNITTVPAKLGEQATPLDYRIDSLKSTGFNLSSEPIAELDGLIAFCEEAFGR